MMRIAAAGSILLVFASVSAQAGTLAAQSGPAQAHKPSPCVEYAKRFCNDVPYGKGRRLRCLDAHRAQLSSACQSQLKVLLVLEEYGEQQRAKTNAYLAKHSAGAQTATKPAPAATPSTAPSPANQTPPK